jgi:AraC-like DNA-binding protein
VSVFRTARPAPGLRQLVRYYYQFDVDLRGRTLLQPVPARSPQAIEFTFGTPYMVRRLARGSVERAHAVALIGAQTFRRVDLIMQGKVDAFTVVFQPGGLFRLFSLPAQLVTNDHFEGQLALGRRLGELERRLGDVTSFHDRVRIADDWLCARRPVVDAMTHMARAAAEVLSRSGCIRVADLARSAGIGVRQFERRFVHEIGVTPKLYARIARFEAALRRKAAAPEMRWTDIAHALEYHDQMHMVHDFNRLSGASPTVIGGQLDMFVQPELASVDRSIPSGG